MMPTDFFLAVLGFLAATVVGWLIHVIRTDLAYWRHQHDVTTALLLANSSGREPRP